MNKRRELTDTEIHAILDLYINKEYSILKISKLFELDRGKIEKVLSKYNIKIRHNDFYARQYTCNSKYFDKIDSEHKAYWFGFLYADGYVGSQHHIGLALSSIDKNHIESFKEDIDATYPIHTYWTKQNNSSFKSVEYSRLILKDDYLFNSLVEKGIVEHKSNILKYPSESIVPDNLTYHFIRGFFDGNGCLTYWYNKHGYFSSAIKICSTYEFLQELKTKLPINQNLIFDKRHNNGTNNYSLDIGGNIQVSKLLNLFYKNSTIYLPRKYNKMIEFFNIYNKAKEAS